MLWINQLILYQQILPSLALTVIVAIIYKEHAEWSEPYRGNIETY